MKDNEGKLEARIVSGIVLNDVMVRINHNLSRWVQACTLCYVNLINYMDRYTVSGMSTLINYFKNESRV